MVGLVIIYCTTQPLNMTPVCGSKQHSWVSKNLQIFPIIFSKVKAGCCAGFWFFFLGGGVTRKMGVVHKNFISFVSMITWREALLHGVWRAAAPPRSEEFWKFNKFFQINYIKFAENCKIVNNLGLVGGPGAEPPDARQFSKNSQKIL